MDERQRLLDDRDELEQEAERLNEELKLLDEDSDEWEQLYREITHLENEAAYCTALLADY